MEKVGRLIIHLERERLRPSLLKPISGRASLRPFTSIAFTLRGRIPR
jgi:hypothetical protein